MAFKSMEQYNEERFGNFFQLRNDKDQADVIFLYENYSQCLMADTHYLKSANYNGYVHCCGSNKGCPACQKGIRVQPKLFIPLYNITTQRVEFWDRTPRFEPQLQNDVFAKFPNPSEFIFRITRNGVAGSVDTTYSIVPIAKNTLKSYAQILVDNQITLPDYYNSVCKELSAFEMQSMLVDTSKPLGDYAGAPAANPGAYGAVPRGASAPVTIPEPPAVAMPQYSAPPECIPGMPQPIDATVPGVPAEELGSYEALPEYPASESAPTIEPVIEAPVVAESVEAGDVPADLEGEPEF